MLIDQLKKFLAEMHETAKEYDRLTPPGAYGAGPKLRYQALKLQAIIDRHDANEQRVEEAFNARVSAQEGAQDECNN